MLPEASQTYSEETQEKIKKAKKRNASGIGRISREELYQEVQSGAVLSFNYIMMILFSSIVAAVGLISNDVAVIVGSMVIAPFLRAKSCIVTCNCFR